MNRRHIFQTLTNVLRNDLQHDNITTVSPFLAILNLKRQLFLFCLPDTGISLSFGLDIDVVGYLAMVSNLLQDLCELGLSVDSKSYRGRLNIKAWLVTLCRRLDSSDQWLPGDCKKT